MRSHRSAPRRRRNRDGNGTRNPRNATYLVAFLARLYATRVMSDSKAVPQPTNIFSDLKVLDLASFIAGPAAATILSDFGADVIKVEPPGIGDPYRFFSKAPPNPQSEANYPWQLTNRNKRSIALDLKSEAAKEVLQRLAQWADVMVVNFPPRVKQSLGLAFEQVSPLNPRLIYADITGYGANGAEADRPGFDLTAYWARTGLMQVTHDAGSPPTLPIPGIGDHATASTLYGAIVTGLYIRERTGKGTHVSTSLIAEGAWAAATWIEGALNGAHFFGQHNRKAPPNALMNPYRTADDRWLLLVAAQEKDWPGFVKAIGMPQLLEDARFTNGHLRTANAEQLVEILDPLFESQSLAHWKELLEAGRVIFGVVQNSQEIVNDQQMLANEVFVPLAEPTATATHTVSSPLQVAGFSKVAPRRAPGLGEHGVDILKELKFSDADVTRLHDSGAVTNVDTLELTKH
jgi:crotonobetainyl-CoA:carnitine CoA-transferase CaiB-like acyl-CoA transferase